MRLVVVLFVLAAVSVLPAELPEPGLLALDLNEDEFEDYLDSWLELEERKWMNATPNKVSPRSGCAFRVNGDLGQPQPVYIHNNGYPVPTGTTGVIHLGVGEQIRVACTGQGRLLQHPNIAGSVSTAWATCVNNAMVAGFGWLTNDSHFGQLTCSSHSFHEAEYTSQRCYGNNIVIRVGYYVDNVFYPLFWSCFDQYRLEVLYVWYEQTPPHAVHQSGVDRPSWLAGSFFPGVNINNLYTQVSQKAHIARLVGSELADKYVTSSQFLARGHLAAKTDFIYATGQRATFYFINSAPQWQPFNAGNWNWLEQNLRSRIGAAGYHATVYTGTFGVTQLRNQQGELVDIYLNTDSNNNPQLPVPLYYYKVVYDADRRLGTAFVSINNPHYSLAEARALAFCTDHCRSNAAFSWLNWHPDRVDLGYSFCCSIDEFRRTVPHLPNFTVNGLLS